MELVSLGVDIGGTGIKVGLVDMVQGTLIGERRRVRTPQPATPEAVLGVVQELVSGFRYHGPVGIGFPAVIQGGVVKTANNIDPSWIGVNALGEFARVLNREVGVVNDGDAAALCESRFGAARYTGGVVLVLTFGTGIGSGLLHNGQVIPNVEVGGMELDGYLRAEFHYSDKARRQDQLTPTQWAERVSRFVEHLNVVFSPQLVVVGGGAVKDWEVWSPYLTPGLNIVPADRGNHAGIIGAAAIVN